MRRGGLFRNAEFRVVWLGNNRGSERLFYNQVSGRSAILEDNILLEHISKARKAFNALSDIGI